jgi:hypothetical protein
MFVLLRATNSTPIRPMPIFFTMMMIGAVAIIYLCFKDVPGAPWNKRKNKA